MRTLTLLFALTLAACNGGSTDKDPSPKLDQDQDGWTGEEDCDDTNGAVFPGAGEVCDGIDNDCDGEIDEYATDATVFYLDQDSDRNLNLTTRRVRRRMDTSKTVKT